MLLKFSLFLLLFVCINGLKLPSYIKPCSVTDPNLNECAIKHGQDAMPFIIKGDKKYRIPELSPLKIPEIKFSSGDLNIKLNDVNISGLDDIEIQDVNLNIPDKHVTIKVSIERANLLSEYDISGRILILPMNGQGQANITFVGGEYTYTFDYTLTDKDGEQYMEIANNNLEYSTKRSYYHFDNLFGGDNSLGDHLNEFLDENWMEVEHDIGPALSQTINSIITTIMTEIFEKVPFNGVFLP